MPSPAPNTLRIWPVSGFAPRRLLLALSFAVFCFGLTESCAGTTESPAKRLASQRAAVVSLSITVAAPGPAGAPAAEKSHRTIELCGTVVSANGLTLTSLHSIFPPGKRPALIRILGKFEDDAPIEMEFVRENVPLDLALLRPKIARPQPFSFLNFETAGEIALLDTVYVVGRAPSIFGHAPMIREVKVEAIFAQPNACYLPSNSQMGCPVLNASGHPVGICLRAIVDGSPTGPAVILNAATLQLFIETPAKTL